MLDRCGGAIHHRRTMSKVLLLLVAVLILVGATGGTSVRADEEDEPSIPNQTLNEALQGAGDDAPDGHEPPLSKPPPVSNDTELLWSPWRPNPVFGPGSGRRGGLTLLRVNGTLTALEVRLGLTDYVQTRYRSLADGQEEFEQPIVHEVTDTATTEADPGGIAGLTTYIGGLTEKYRFFYFIMFFD
jgi:hypothetical protein